MVYFVKGTAFVITILLVRKNDPTEITIIYDLLCIFLINYLDHFQIQTQTETKVKINLCGVKNLGFCLSLQRKRIDSYEPGIFVSDQDMIKGIFV